MENGASSYRRYLNGDELAFEQIVKEYREPLTLFINGFTHDLFAAEDIAIDVFAYIASEPRRYNFKVSLKTYLYMLGRSRAIDYLRKRKRELTLSFEDSFVALSAEPSAEEEYIAEEERRELYSAISKLPQKMREVVYLVYLENMSYEEAAKIMKTSRKQVDNLLYRAKEELRLTIGRKV